MRLTLEALRLVVRKELDRDPGQSTYESLINEAGEAWVNLFEWPYLRERSQRLELIAGTETYKLGPGVRSVNTLYRPETVYQPIQLIDFARWTMERERYLSGITRLYDPLATVVWDQEPDDAAPCLYLKVYPATRTEAVVFEYEAGWLPLDKSQDVADIPAPLTQSFIEFLRRYTLARETDKATVDSVLGSFMQGPQGVIARRASTSHTGEIVPAPGAAGEIYNRRKALRGLYGRRASGYGPFCQLDYLRFR